MEVTFGPKQLIITFLSRDTEGTITITEAVYERIVAVAFVEPPPEGSATADDALDDDGVATADKVAMVPTKLKAKAKSGGVKPSCALCGNSSPKCQQTCKICKRAFHDECLAQRRTLGSCKARGDEYRTCLHPRRFSGAQVHRNGDIRYQCVWGCALAAAGEVLFEPTGPPFVRRRVGLKGPWKQTGVAAAANS